MTWIFSVILCLLFKASSCQLRCARETLNDKEFSINVITAIKVKSGDCFWIEYDFTFPTNKVTPLSKIWFQGDPQNTKIHIEQNKEVVYDVKPGTRDHVRIKALPQGEYEHGFKLEWECDQTLFNRKTNSEGSSLTEGKAATLECHVPPLCPDIVPHMSWIWNMGILSISGIPYSLRTEIIPAADHHNSNITCAAEFNSSIVETTVTLTVKFAPRILSSQCMVDGRLLVCVCISWGNPLPRIRWPSDSLTDFSVIISKRDQTVNSTIIMPAADYHASIVRCGSSTELGKAYTEIPLQNYTGDLRLKYGLDSSPKSDAVLSWIITGVSLSLNLALVTALIICTVKRGKRQEQRKKLSVEMHAYDSLHPADVDQHIYSNLSPSPTQTT